MPITDKAKKYLQLILYASKLILPKNKHQLLPVVLHFKFIQYYYNNNCHQTIIMQSKFRLIPIPKKLYTLLTAREFLKSEHYIIVPENIFDEYIKCKELNWLNLNFENKGFTPKSTNNEPEIVASILKKPTSSILVPVISVPSQCESNCVFINENCYYNFLTKYKINENEPVTVQLQELQDSQNVPQLSTKATIFILNNPHEVSNDLVDEILDKYFESPRILYRNYTCEIPLDEATLGNALHAKYFHIFSSLRRINFRCVHIESKDNPFQIDAIVSKGLTILQQTNSINFTVPKQYLHDLCPITACPTGLISHFDALKSSILPFIPNASNGNGLSSSTTISSLTSQNIFPTFLLQGDRGCGKYTVLTSVAQSLGIQVYSIDCAELVSQVSSQTEAKVKIVLNKSNICEPLIISLYNFEIFGVDNEGREDLRILSMFQSELQTLFSKERVFPVILVCLTSEKEIKPLIQRIFLEVIKIGSPSKEQRYDLLQWLHTTDQISEKIFNKHLDQVPLFSLENSKQFLSEYETSDVQEIFKTVSNKTQGFLYGDLRLLYDNSVRELRANKRATINLESFENNLLVMQSSFSDSLGAPKVPKVLWSDIGGLAKLKDEIQTSIGLPLKHLHLMGKNMRRSGILLYGPPGTGKTLVAKAVATECNLSFLSVQGPELLNMYVGQSEQNVREVFARARSAAPCVIFLDELDSLAPNRGVAGDSGGVMDRVVSQLLAEMDGMVPDSEPQKQIFILAATNRPDLIDPALLRPGRFDKLLYVGPCTTIDEKIAVLDAQMKRFSLEKQLTLQSIAELLKQDMTGADLYSICSNAWLSAVRRTILNHMKGKANTEPQPENVVVNINDFKTAAANFIPSVSQKDLEYFHKLKASFSI